VETFLRRSVELSLKLVAPIVSV